MKSWQFVPYDPTKSKTTLPKPKPKPKSSAPIQRQASAVRDGGRTTPTIDNLNHVVANTLTFDWSNEETPGVVCGNSSPCDRVPERQDDECSSELRCEEVQPAPSTRADEEAMEQHENHVGSSLVTASKHNKDGSSEETSQGWENTFHATDYRIPLSGERFATDTVVDTSVIPGANTSTQPPLEPGGDGETPLNPSNMNGLAFEDISVRKSAVHSAEKEYNFERWLEGDAVVAETPIADGDEPEGVHYGKTSGTCEQQESPNHRNTMLPPSCDETAHHSADVSLLSPSDADDQGYISSIESLQHTARPETIPKLGESGLEVGVGANANVFSFQQKSFGSSTNFKSNQLRDYLGADGSFMPSQPETLDRTGECASCHILYEALLKALFLCQQKPVPRPRSSTAHQRPNSRKEARQKYPLRSRKITANGYSEVSSDDESTPGSVTRDTSRAPSVNSLGHGKSSRSLGGSRRRWTQLEERRIRSWKMENKPDAWIAAKLGRTESAVRQQWRKMPQA